MSMLEPSQSAKARKENGYKILTCKGDYRTYVPKPDKEQVVLDMISEIRDHKNWSCYTHGGYFQLARVVKGEVKAIPLPKRCISDSIFDSVTQDTVDIPDEYKTKAAIMAEVRAGIMAPAKAARLYYGDGFDALDSAQRQAMEAMIGKESPYYVATAKAREALYVQNLISKGTSEAIAKAMGKAQAKKGVFKAEKEEEEKKVSALKKDENDYAKKYNGMKMYSVWDWEAEDDLCIGGNPVAFWTREEAESFLELVKAGKIEVDRIHPAPSKDEWESAHANDDRSLLDRMDEDDLKDYREAAWRR